MSNQPYFQDHLHININNIPWAATEILNNFPKSISPQNFMGK